MTKDRSGAFLCMAVAAIVMATGCRGAAFFRQHECGSICDKCCRQSQPVLVDIGGQVQMPTQVDLNAGPMTLRKALMAAGGAREFIVAQATPALAQKSPIATQLDQLVSVSKEHGQYELYQEILTQVPPGDLHGITASAAEVKSALEKNQGDLDKLKTDLSPTVQASAVTHLFNKARNVGYYEELSKRISWLHAYSRFAQLTEKNVATALEQAKQQVATALNSYTTSVPADLRTSSHSIYLVALERPSPSPTTYYFPYDMVVGDQPGDIRLAAGDSVQVLDLRDSALMARGAGLSTDRAVVAIQGLVDQPGIDPGHFSTIGQIQASVQPTTRDPRGTWMLVRTSRTGLRQNVFVLPNNLIGQAGAATDAPTVDGDIYVYTIVPQIPIVLNSTINDLVDVAVGQSVRDCAPRIRNAIERHREVKQQIWEKWRHKVARRGSF